eukprot:TRINITY_DN64551_c0_g1_i1.p1 TRINITY_DN64551_c0_g1~~TRINITY_DN64551_c0_g1_i1.p1  ORF type:complete len:259 (+),score=72.02 TRINITY_DN64551_c0_g1_i1:72-848(+)
MADEKASMTAAAMEEDPFADFLSQEAQGSSGYPAAAPTTLEAIRGGGGLDAGLQMKLLVESSQRQEQLLEKVCSLVANLDARIETLGNNQNRLEATLHHVVSQRAMSSTPVVRDTTKSATPAGINRGSLVAPPGRGPVNPLASPPPTSTIVVSDEKSTEAEDRLARERLRLEEESRRRAEEMQRKRVEEERRRQKEIERQRIEEDRRREEEKLRKQELENKTNAALSGLFGSDSGGGSSLFGDDEAKPKKKSGGLFDD